MTDAEMIAHAAVRGRVVATHKHYAHRLPVNGYLEAWKPHRTRKGADGQPRRRSTPIAVIDGIDYRLNHYTIEAIK